MKILFVTDYFINRSKGGTEIYTYELSKALMKLGNEIAIFTLGNRNDNYLLEGLSIYTCQENSDQHEINQFLLNIIDEFNPDVYHQHTLTPSFGVNLLNIARLKGIKTVYTLHIASVSCISGGLLLFGEKPCDGEIIVSRCTQCYMNKVGYNHKVSFVYAHFINLLISSGLSKLLPSKALVSLNKLIQFNQLNNNTDIFHVFSNWQIDVLLKNKINPNKICKVSHGVTNTEPRIDKVTHNNSVLIIGYSGRITSDKGLHILIQALTRLNLLNIKLIVNGIIDSNEHDYYTNLLTESKNIQVDWLVNEKDDNFYNKIDLLCIPSQVLETGPLVVYEALINQTPVLGSNIGGIAEKIDALKIGWTFIYNDILDLSIKIQKIYNDRNMFETLKLQDNKVPSFLNAAIEVEQSYIQLNAK